MDQKLTNITAPQYRCPVGDCPAVYKSEDGKTFTIVGPEVHPIPEELEGKIGISEGAVKVSAYLLLSSLGVAALIEAAEAICSAEGAPDLDDFYDNLHDLVAALREALSSIKGGK